MLLRRLLTTALVLLAFVMTAPVVNAALPPETKKELSDLMKELKDVSGLIKKKEVNEAKSVISKVEARVKELAIAEDEKDRTYSSFRTQLAKAKNLIPVSFEHEVAPILTNSCLNCHGANQANAGLRLDTFNGLVKGGRSGVPVTPGLPARSALVLRMAADNDQQRMPKGVAKLPDADIMTIARWVEQGAGFDGTDRDAAIGESTVVKKAPVTVVMANGSETVSFRNDVAPWMVNICMGCHSGNTPRGKFGFTTFEQLLQGGPTGATIVPGKPDESYIVDLVLRQEPLKMPAGQAQLKQSQAKALEKWIEEGAHFDGKDPKALLRDLVPTAAEMEATKLAGMSDTEFAERRITQAAELWKRVSPREEGNAATTTNFYFYGTASEERLKQLGAVAETHVEDLTKRYPLPGGEQAFRGRLAVFVTSERFDYEEFNTVLMNRRTPKAISGHSVMNANFETAYVAMQDVGDTESASSLTAEQMMNSLISQAYLTRDGSSLPDWLKQGFGMLESGLASDSVYVKAIPGRAAKAVSTIVDAGKMFDDGTLAPEEVGDVGYLMVKFLMGQGGPARFQQLVGELRKNPDAAKAIQLVYRTPPAQLGQAFLQSGGTMKCRRPLKTTTAAELLVLSPGMHCELIHGEIKPMSPAGAEHGWTVARLTVRLGSFVEEHQLGFVFGAETGFILERDPDTVRAPDVSFVRADRIPTRPPRNFLPFAPDLAVEVISPGDSSSDVSLKAEQWLRCGSLMVWLVDPARDSAAVCVVEDGAFVSRTAAHLTAPVLLPGFSLSVKTLFGV